MRRSFRCALIVTALAVVSPALSNAAQDPSDKIKLQAKLVNVPVTVVDREGRYVTGFVKEDKSSIASGGSRWHRLRVRVRAPRALGRLSVIHKKGYQAFN